MFFTHQRAAGVLLVFMFLGCSEAATKLPPASTPGSTKSDPLSSLKGAANALLKDKSDSSLIALLKLNGQDVSGIQKIGGSIEWPQQFDVSSEYYNDIVYDAKMVKAKGERFILAVCNVRINRKSKVGEMEPILTDRAFVFTSDGSLLSVFGDSEHESDAFFLSLGTTDRWFVWIQKSTRQPGWDESDVYLIDEPLTPAIKVRHSTNGPSYTPNAITAKRRGSGFVFNDGDGSAVDLGTFVGRDGKKHPPTLQWDNDIAVFRGAGRLETKSGVIFEVDESVSKRFIATDVGK